MAKFRVMSYHLNGLSSASGTAVISLCAEVIRSHQPELVSIQGVRAKYGDKTLTELSKMAGLEVHGFDTEGGCAFLSRRPLHNIQVIPLGFDCNCVRADYDQAEEKIHLYNLALSWNPVQRLAQVRKLFDDQILNNPAFPCATMICGDFGLPFWGCGKVALNLQIVRADKPLWRVNYPAVFPLWGRGRVYFQGPIRALDGAIIRTEQAKKASTHLPLLLTVETSDTRKTLKVKDHSTLRQKQTSPVCG